MIPKYSDLDIKSKYSVLDIKSKYSVLDIESNYSVLDIESNYSVLDNVILTERIISFLLFNLLTSPKRSW